MHSPIKAICWLAIHGGAAIAAYDRLAPPCVILSTWETAASHAILLVPTMRSLATQNATPGQSCRARERRLCAGVCYTVTGLGCRIIDMCMGTCNYLLSSSMAALP